MAKVVKDGVNLTNKDAVELLIEFSSFKDRVEKKFKELSKEFSGRSNEHDLWVNLYLVATDYSDEVMSRRKREEVHQIPNNVNNNLVQKLGLNV